MDDMNEKLHKTLGNKMKRAREKAKLTQSEAAVLVEIHTNYYARIERGEENPTLDVLHRIKKALKIESDLV